MYIYSVTYTSEVIAGENDQIHFFLQRGNIPPMRHARVKREKKIERTIPLQLIYASRATTLLRTCNKE